MTPDSDQMGLPGGPEGGHWGGGFAGKPFYEEADKRKSGEGASPRSPRWEGFVPSLIQQGQGSSLWGIPKTLGAKTHGIFISPLSSERNARIIKMPVLPSGSEMTDGTPQPRWGWEWDGMRTLAPLVIAF